MHQAAVSMQVLCESLSELAFDMEFEEGAAASPGGGSVMHSAWTEREALQARHSSGWGSDYDSEGAEESGSPLSAKTSNGIAAMSHGIAAARAVRAQSPLPASVTPGQTPSFQCVTHALFDFEFEPCPELDAIYAKYLEATRQEASAQIL